MKLRKQVTLLALGLAIGLGVGFGLSIQNGTALKAFPKGDSSSFSVRAAKVEKAPLGDITLGYRSFGKGPPLLLIMGYAGTMDVWDPRLIEKLASSRRVILFDNRGMGTSSGSHEPFSIELFAQDSLKLMEALSLKKADVLGWSMGSLIAQEMALMAPERIGKLVLYGSAPDTVHIMKALAKMEELSPDAFMAQLFPADWTAKNPGIFAKLPAPAEQPDPAVLKKQKNALGTWKGTVSRLPRLNHETLLIVGEEDDITPTKESLALASKIHGAWVARFKGAGHWLMYQAPEDFAKTVLLFLNAQQKLVP